MVNLPIPAKGVGRVTGAKVQILSTPPLSDEPLFYKGFIFVIFLNLLKLSCLN